MSEEPTQMDKHVEMPEMHCDGCQEPIGSGRGAVVRGDKSAESNPFTHQQAGPVKIQCFDCRKSGRQDEFGDDIYEIEIGGRPVEVRCDCCNDPVQPPVEFYAYKELSNHRVELKTACSRECFRKIE
jgi:hypothetical protein